MKTYDFGANPNRRNGLIAVVLDKPCSVSRWLICFSLLFVLGFLSICPEMSKSKVHNRGQRSDSYVLLGTKRYVCGVNQQCM